MQIQNNPANQTRIMGVINMSPNSFINGHTDVDLALKRVEQMVADGAEIIDVGGEATNPFVDIVREAPSVDEELARVMPLIAAIKNHFDVLISVDTSQPKVMQAVLQAGASMINDQRALQIPGAREIVANSSADVCLMHFFNPLRTPDSSSRDSLLLQIKQDLQLAVELALQAGIARDRLLIDPGFGGGNYGKSTAENYFLLSRLNEFAEMGLPLVIGWSRKSMIGETLGGVKPIDRLFGSLAAETIIALKNPAIIRTHDVKPVSDALKIVSHYLQAENLC